MRSPLGTHRPHPKPHGRKYDAVTWRDTAACLNADLNMFFPSGRGSQDELYAYRVCATCPVVDACLEEALSFPASYDFGVWGMTNERQRTRIRGGTLTVAVARARNRLRFHNLQEVS